MNILNQYKKVITKPVDYKIHKMLVEKLEFYQLKLWSYAWHNHLTADRC